MNITIGNNNKQTTRQILGVAASAALALTALAGFSGALDRETRARPSTQGATSAVSRPFTARPALQVLLVDTEQQKSDLDADFARDAILLATRGERAAEQAIVVVKGTPLEASLAGAIADIISSGGSGNVVDTTSRPRATMTAQPQFGTAVDAEYAARSLVPVSELPRSQAIQPMFATEADAEFASEALYPAILLSNPSLAGSQARDESIEDYAARERVVLETQTR